MSNDFDWFGNNEADLDHIVLGYQPPTAVYRTKTGSVVIRQKMEMHEEYDPEIHLTPQGALAVAWRLIEEAHLQGLPSPSLSLMVDSDNWPPPGVGGRPAPTAAPAPAASEPGPLLAVMEAANDGTAGQKGARQ